MVTSGSAAKQDDFPVVIPLGARLECIANHSFTYRVFSNRPEDNSRDRKSKLLRDTGLPQHRVGGMPGEDLPVYRKTPSCYRAVPDFMVPSAGSLKMTSMRRESPSRPGCNWPSEDQDVTIFVLVQYVETRAPVVGDAIQLQQLGDKGS